MSKKGVFTILCLVMVLAALLARSALAQSGYEIPWWSIDSGGGGLGQGDFILDGTIGQPDTGLLNAGIYSLHGGFQNSVAGPTAVTLASFQAVQQPDGILLAWDTLDEIHCLGFNLERRDVMSGMRLTLNKDLIRCQHTGQMRGAHYEWFDYTAVNGASYAYRLEMLSIDGSSYWTGALSVVVGNQLMYLPFARR